MKRVDCCPYCTLAFCSVISISTQGLITPLHYTMSGAPGSRLRRHAPFDWPFRLALGPQGLAGKQEEGLVQSRVDGARHPRPLAPALVWVCVRAPANGNDGEADWFTRTRSEHLDWTASGFRFQSSASEQSPTRGHRINPASFDSVLEQDIGAGGAWQPPGVNG